MRKTRFWTLLAVAGIFLLGLAWQASRFADLSAKARNLERIQEAWIVENRKVDAEIAQLASRERTMAMARRLGLAAAKPEDVTKVQIAPKGRSE
ncbi:MAG: cell division protein FtsL [Spirochaetota bacterium]